MKTTTLLFIIGLTISCFGLETAITTSGKKVILKNDGTWEPFDESRHLDAQDLRSNQKVEISLKYKDHSWCSKEKRMLLEAEDLPERAIQDSLKKVPKGGIILVQVPTANVDYKDPRTYDYKVRDSKGKLLVQQQSSESSAVVADEPGLSTLIELNLPGFKKGNLKIEIQEKGTRQTYEYDLSMQE